MAGDAQAAVAWRDAYERVSGLAARVAINDPAALQRTVPACPDWTAQDLLAHMIGVDRDSLADDVAEDLNDDWTQRQVDQRAEASTADLLEEWASMADDVEAFVRDQDPTPLGDIVIHEQDLRGALEMPGARDSAGVEAIREQTAQQLADGLGDRGPIRLQATDSDWVWTSGDGEPAVVLQASGFDLARALTTRRTAEQLRSYVVEGDIEPYLDDFTAMGPLPQTELPE